MNVSHLLIAVATIIATVAVGQFSGWIIQFYPEDSSHFPFSPPWAVITNAFTSVLPGVAFGFLVRVRTMLLGMAVGMVSGVLDVYVSYHVLLVPTGAADRFTPPNVMDYFATSVAFVVFTSTAVALGMVIRSVLLANHSLKLDGPDGPPT